MFTPPAMGDLVVVRPVADAEAVAPEEAVAEAEVTLKSLPSSQEDMSPPHLHTLPWLPPIHTSR